MSMAQKTLLMVSILGNIACVMVIDNGCGGHDGIAYCIQKLNIEEPSPTRCM